MAQQPHQWIPLLAVVCAGCPFVFGPPNLSNVDVGATGDTGTPVDSAPVGETGDTATVPTFDPPQVVDLQVKRFVDRIGFSFAVVDADEDLVGGTITLAEGEGTAPIVLEIPGGLQVWDPLGTSIALVPADWLPCDGLDETWQLTITDANGHVGVPAESELVIIGIVPPDEFEVFDFNLLGAPTVACVQFDFDPSLPNPQQQLQADQEDYAFTAASTGLYSFQIAWQTVMDIDMALMRGQTLLFPPYPVVGPDWEQFEFNLVAGEQYRLQSTYFNIPGNTPPYVGTVLMLPPVALPTP